MLVVGVIVVALVVITITVIVLFVAAVFQTAVPIVIMIITITIITIIIVFIVSLLLLLPLPSGASAPQPCCSAHSARRCPRHCSLCNRPRSWFARSSVFFTAPHTEHWPSDEAAVLLGIPVFHGRTTVVTTLETVLTA